MSNMIHIQECQDIDCELCEDLVTDGLVWVCDECGGPGNSCAKNEGFNEGEVICDVCAEKGGSDE